jgi:hypothetical protein
MRGVSDIGGLRAIKTLHTTGRRSILRVQGSAYLDLYMRKKEKERLEKELSILERRRKGIEKRLQEISKEIELLENPEQKRPIRVKGDGTEGSIKKWKTMDLRY